MKTSEDEFVRGGGEAPPCIRLTSDALPEVLKSLGKTNSYTGVSTRYAPIGDDDLRCWHVLRCAYGREKKAYEYFREKGIRVRCTDFG